MSANLSGISLLLASDLSCCCKLSPVAPRSRQTNSRTLLRSTANALLSMRCTLRAALYALSIVGSNYSHRRIFVTSTTFKRYIFLFRVLHYCNPFYQAYLDAISIVV